MFLGERMARKTRVRTQMSDREHQLEGSPEPSPDSERTPSLSASQPTIGERVRAARLAAHLTQLELAGTLFSKSYVSAVERGKMTPSLLALGTLAQRLGVPLKSLLGEETWRPPMKRPPEQVAERFQEAQVLVEQGDYEAAHRLAEQWGDEEIMGWVSEAWAQALAAQGRYEEAYKQMQRAAAAPHPPTAE